MSYDDQCSLKQERVNSLFRHVIKPEKIIGMSDPLHYRNKVQVSFGKDEKGRAIAGNYAKDSHTLIPVDECMIADERANAIISSVTKLVRKHKISVFDEWTYKGCMRHLLIRTASTGEIMLVLVTGTSFINEGDSFVKDILHYNPSVTTVIQSVNNARTSMILGKNFKTLYGKGYITDELLGFRFRISPSSFYQVNRRQTEVLYQTAISFAGLAGTESVIDAYCGTGTIAIAMSPYAKEVTGVEINPQAVKDASRNAEENHIRNVSFICEDAGKYMKKIAKEGKKTDLVMMDPPRSGSDETFLNALCTLRPEKIVYISCGPDTLRRDVGYLLKKGYEIKKLQPVDMFPFTGHVECVTLLERKKM